MLRALDGMFVTSFEKGTRAMQMATGLTNYYVAGLCSFLLALIFAGTYLQIFPAYVLQANKLVPLLIATCPAIFWLAVALFAGIAGFCKKLEEIRIAQLKKGYANPQKVSVIYTLFRLCMLIVIVAYVPTMPVYDAVISVLLFVFLNLLACDPLHPNIQKERKPVACLYGALVPIPIRIPERRK